jgi:hypothetical protein
MLSYLPADKAHVVNERGEWAREGRQFGKPSKVIKKALSNYFVKKVISAKDFESFGHKYKAKFMDNGFVWQMRPAKDAYDVYSMERRDSGTLGDSCMNGDDYFDIYRYCKHLQILTLIDKDGLLCGRALVWNVTIKEQDAVFMDRMYVSDEYMYDLFLNYARENNMWRKMTYKKYTEKAQWVNPETDKVEQVYVTISTDTDHDQYPYIDTFSFGSQGTLTNCSGETYTYNNADGTREGDEDEGNCYDEIDECTISEDDSVGLSSYGDRVYRDRRTHINNAQLVYVHGRCEEYMHTNDTHVVTVERANGRTDSYYSEHEDVVIDVDGTFRHIEDCVYCNTDCESYLSDSDDIFEAHNGDYYRKDDKECILRTDEYGDDKWYHSSDPLVRITIDGKIELLTDVVVCDNKFYPKNDKRIRLIKVNTKGVITTEYHLKTSIVKWNNRYYHQCDSRLAPKLFKYTTTIKTTN